MHTATIKLFLVHGDPQRLRIAQMANWNGNAIAGPRTDLHHLFGRDESRLAGVYLLAGTDPRSGKFTVLIGIDSSVRDGIKRHLGQDFWNSAIIVTASDRNLTMPELAYLEAELILAAKVAERAQVLHDVAQHVELREPDKGVMEDFLVRVQQILPVLGTDLLVPLRREIGIANQPILVCTATGISARGVEQPRGFVVLKGSQAALDEQPLDKQVENARRLRARLLEQGVLERGNGFLQFTQDHEFTSHTEAALVVLGANVDGACAWTTEGGHTLQQIEVERVWDLP